MHHAAFNKTAKYKELCAPMNTVQYTSDCMQLYHLSLLDFYFLVSVQDTSRYTVCIPPPTTPNIILRTLCYLFGVKGIFLESYWITQ